MTMKGRGIRGFTFAEMIASAAAMAVLVGTLAATALSLINYSKAQTTRAQMLEIKDASERFYSDNAQAPTAINDLIEPPSPGKQWRNWQGPYLSHSVNEATQDAWNRSYTFGPGLFLSSTSSTGIPVILIVSPGKNGVLDANYNQMNWQNAVWLPGGDDLTLQFPLRIQTLDPVDTTRNTLDLARARILTDNPTTPPNNWGVASYVDAWGKRIQYYTCNNNQAFVYSYGPNQADDSNGGAYLCNAPPSMGDDIVDAIVWEVRRPPATPTWTGGFDVQPTHCASYSLSVTDRYPAGTQVTINHSGNRTSTVNGGTVATITTGPQEIRLWNGSLLLDDFKPASADLNSDCIVSKTVGIAPPPP